MNANEKLRLWRRDKETVEESKEAQEKYDAVVAKVDREMKGESVSGDDDSDGWYVHQRHPYDY